MTFSAAEADAAHLRQVFESCASDQEAWKNNPMAIWIKLYEGIRDSTAGLALLKDIHLIEADRELFRNLIMDASVVDSCTGEVKYGEFRDESPEPEIYMPPLALPNIPALEEKIAKYEAAVKEHHSQKAGDRCRMDDDKLYAAFNLPPADVRVGDKVEMLKDCERFIDRRCESGGWITYRELEAERDKLILEAQELRSVMMEDLRSSEDCKS